MKDKIIKISKPRRLVAQLKTKKEQELFYLLTIFQGHSISYYLEIQ